jgi:hypothetical protein
MIDYFKMLVTLYHGYGFEFDSTTTGTIYILNQWHIYQLNMEKLTH